MFSEEGKYLEGEKRIDFLVGKIQEIRKIYMQLKAEVACIDRRRKRHRRRERESNKGEDLPFLVRGWLRRGHNYSGYNLS